jgi:hypothetical protein
MRSAKLLQLGCKNSNRNEDENTLLAQAGTPSHLSIVTLEFDNKDKWKCHVGQRPWYNLQRSDQGLPMLSH